MDKRLALLAVVFVCFFPTNSCAVIRAQILPATDREASDLQDFAWQISALKRFRNRMVPILETLGLVFVDKDPDVIFCSGKLVKKLGLLSKKVPLIILESDDYASLRLSTRSLLRHDLVKAVFKNRILEPKDLYNEPVCNGRYHFNLIFNLVNNHAGLVPPYKVKPFTPDQLLKIKCVLWDLELSCDRFCSSYSFESINRERPVDVFFAGKISFISYGLYAFHRKKALEIIRQIKGINIVVLEGRQPLSFDKYMEKMRSSKIVVSPWGMGEWCYRDCEAIAAGAVLIKPDSGFLRALPNIYQNNITYVACKQDFSDLKEKITYVLDHYNEFKEMKERAVEELFSGYNIQKICKDFVSAVQMVLNEYAHKPEHEKVENNV